MEETRRVLYGGDKADEGYFFRLRLETRRVPGLGLPDRMQSTCSGVLAVDA